MKKTSKNKGIKNKLLLPLCAVAMPIAATVATGIACPIGKANADTSAANYYSSYVKEMSMTNNNFNSSSSTYSLSTSLSGWTGKLSNSKTTAGIINTGTSFQNYMSGTYHLSKNPLAKASDSSILMINSKTSETSKNTEARQGYSSNTVSLEANSYYSFQVSFKADTDYSQTTTYVESGVVTDENKTVSKTSFEKQAFSEDFEPVYVELSLGTTTYNVRKTLTANSTPLASDLTLTAENKFYEDENFAGFNKDGNIFYVRTRELDIVDGEITIYSTSTTYSCNLQYDTAAKNYKVDSTEKYYSTKTEYTSLNDHIFGSIYLSGLKDADGKAVKAEFTEVTSKEWVTFYFFVATGDTAQETTLDLWLGAEKEGYASGGVVFFDDCHVFQYSENAFWKTYNAYANRSYEQKTTDGQSKKTNCTQIFNFKNPTQIEYPSNNFDFETGVLDGGSPVTDWAISGTGKARIYNTGAPEAFKAHTGYDFVGSNLSCKVDMEDGTVSISKNDYVLGLTAKKEYVKVTSNDILIEANSIYKIKAYYKISELSEGNAYMFVEESDSVLSAYNLKDTDYTLLSQTASSGLTSNGSDQFNNNYGVVEFYVKGGSLYNSAIKISLGLGNENETATGCVVFDDITVTKASSADFENASNKATLDESSANLSVTNGDFNDVTIDKDGNFPLAPVDWTISGGELSFGGVINSAQSEHEKYLRKYEELASQGIDPAKNPYYWANVEIFGNSTVGNRHGSKTDTDNILMLANTTDKSWQNVKTPNISLSAGSVSRISFWYNTAADITVTLYDNSGFQLSKAQKLSTGGVWEEYEIFVKAGDGASEVYFVIELGNEKETQFGYAFFDHFALKSIEETDFSAEVDKKGNTVDMSNFYLNLPTNNIPTETPTTNISEYAPAFEGKDVVGNSGFASIVKSESLEESENFKIKEEEEKNVFFIQNQTSGTYAIQSRFNLDLENDYYKLSFKLKTHFEGTLDSKKTYKYGVTVGLTGFDYMSELKSDEKYEEYSIYFHPSEATTAQLYISLISDAPETIGAAAIYDLKLEKATNTEYDIANTTFKDKKYDVNKDRVFIANASATEENPDDPDDSNTDNEAGKTNNDLNWSILVSSILMGAAIVIAIVGVVLRNIKLKKIEKKRRESYDRKSSLEVDVVKAKAKAEKDAQVAEIQKNIDRFQNELGLLEAKHKEKIVGLRSQDKDEVSKATDREFKDFARKRTAVAEKIESLNKQMETVKSPEYLLDLERKIYAQEIARKHQLEKASKRENKKAEKEKAKKERAKKSK